MSNKPLKWFLYSTAVMLFVTAALVLLHAVTGERVMELPNPLLGFSERKVFCVAGILLLSISAFLLVSRNTHLRLVLLTCLSCNLVVYHFGMAYHGGASLIACLGNLSPLIPFTPKTTNLLVSLFLACLFLSSAGFLLADWLVRRNAQKHRGAVGSSGDLEAAVVN